MADILVNWEAAGNILDSGAQIVGQVGIGGLASQVRIPVPGTKGLAIEFIPRGRIPKGGSTSRIFVQDVTGKRVLRLDFGHNVKTKVADFHWNQKGAFKEFGIPDHAPAGRAGAALYKSARYFRLGGRVFVVAAAAADAYSVVTSDRPWRQLAVVSGGWAGAWAGCKMFGAVGATVGTAIEPGGGTIIGGVVGCFAGSLGGYWAGKTLVTLAADGLAPERIGPTVEELPSAAAGGMSSLASENACWEPPPVCSASVGVYAP